MDKKTSQAISKLMDDLKKQYPTLERFGLYYSEADGKAPWVVGAHKKGDNNTYFGRGGNPQQAYVALTHNLAGTEPPPF